MHGVSILGMVTNDLDVTMHGTRLGIEQLKMSTEQWIRKSDIVQHILTLRKLGFSVYIATDHGNVEAKGIKNLKIKEKIGSLSRGKRFLHFSNEVVLKNFQEQNPDLELGTKDLSVYLKNAEAFTSENITVVTHGGSNIWEVLIPFVEIK